MHTKNFRIWTITVLLIPNTFASCHQASEPQPQNLQQTAFFNRLSDTASHDLAPKVSEKVNRLRQEPTVSSVDLIDLNPAAALKSRIDVPLTYGTLEMQKTGGEVQDAHNFTWLGTLQSNGPGGMTLVVKEGQVTGTITSTQGMFRIVPLGDGMHALVKLDVSKFPADEPPNFAPKSKKPPTLVHPKENADTGLVSIDVLVAYTPSAKAAINASGDLDSTLKLAVLEANQSYQLSKINIQLNLVDSFELPVTEGTNSFDQILAKFVADPVVKQHRDKGGADLQVLIINKSDYCGLADAILATEETAFAIVHYNCATGYYSFAHELGHLMGARHDEETDPTLPPFPYGHGYRDHMKWRTIMAYNCPQSCNRIQYWSNPNVMYGGEPMGIVNRSDNARVLNETATTMASFRKRPN